MTKKTNTKSRLLALLLALSVVLTQFSFADTAFAAESSQPNVWFEKTNGEKVQLDDDTLNITSNDNGRIVITAPADCAVEDYANFEWDKNEAWNNAKEYVEFSQDWEMGTRNGGYYATIKKAGNFEVPYKYQNSDFAWIYKSIKVNVTAEESKITELKAVIKRDKVSDKEVLNGDSYDFLIADGAEAYVELYGKINDEWVKQDNNVFSLSVVSGALQVVDSTDSFYINPDSYPAEGVLKIFLNSEPETFMTINVKGIKEVPDTKEPEIYLQTKDSVINMENNTFVVDALTEGQFKLSNVSYEVIDWDCEEEYSYTNEDGNREFGFNYWINENGTYQPHGVKVMDATVTAWADEDRTNEVYKHTFKIDTKASGVEQIKIVDSQKNEIKDLKLNGREWYTVNAMGLLDGEWINLPAQAFIIEPQRNIHVQGNRFCLWTADDKYKITVKMVDNDNVKTSFDAVSGKVDVESFEVTVPKTTWEMDKWDSMANEYVGIRYYADPSVDLGYHVNIQPANATNQSLNFESSDPEVAVYIESNSAGIVPKKAGKVTFTITSKDNPSLPAQKLDLEFVYKTPLKGAVAESEYTMDSDSIKDFTVNTTPSNATEKRFVWTTSNPDVLKVDQQIMVDENGNTVMTYKLVSKNVSKTETVTVTGIPYDTTAGCKPVTFTVTVKEEAKDQWILSGNRWWYRYADGSYAVGWELINGSWYHFDAEGWMQTGWLNLNGTWYYLTESGAMATGWVYVNGTWYFMNESGAMQLGWNYINDSWYYMNASGAMQLGWNYINGSWYYMNASGAMQLGWNYIDGSWYHMDNSGAMQLGWNWIDGKCYYFYSNGAMAEDTWIDGSYVDASGAWIK